MPNDSHRIIAADVTFTWSLKITKNKMADVSCYVKIMHECQIIHKKTRLGI